MAVAGLGPALVALGVLLAEGAPSDGARAAPSTGLGAAPRGGVAAAWSWLLTQRGTGTPVTTARTIRPSRVYPADWTGPVTGTVTGEPVHPGWWVRALVITDITYPINTGPVAADGSFAFPESRPGTKSFQLVAGEIVLAEYAPDFGLLRSYATGERTMPTTRHSPS